MAARTSTSVGVGVTVTILGVATLALFVTTVIFLSQKRAAEKKFNELQEGINEFVRTDERSRDDVQQIKAAAVKAHKSLVGFMLENQQEVMQKVSGSRRDSLEDLANKLKQVEGADTQSMLVLIRDRDAQITALKRQVADAETARDRALQDKETEVKRVKAMEDSQKANLAALTGEVDKYKDEVDRLRQQVNEAKAEMDKRVDRIQQEASDKQSQLTSDINKLNSEKALDKEMIARLQGELKGQRFTGQAEYSLVDGQVIGMDPVEGTVIINRGRKQKVVLGMPFEVYSDATAIRPDEKTGEIPAGKASIEVVRVDDNSSVGRILREKKGNPLVKGDVIANAVYDPNKKYKFLVYGNFDVNGDGRATPEEQNDIRAMITNWGGIVVDELAGDVDFIVLGEKPVLPPEPPANADINYIQQYVMLKRGAVRYDELFAQAIATSIPVLNQNRLYTLTGGFR